MVQKDTVRHLLLIIPALILAICLDRVAAADLDSVDTAAAAGDQVAEPSSKYCGIYCVYAALGLEGRAVDFDDLLRKEYVGNARGSSIADLVRAATKYGLHTLPVTNISATTLRNLTSPVILHVKADAESTTYDHFVLFLGVRNGQAKIYDPPTDPQVVPFGELSARWGGTGLILSSDPIRASQIFWSEWRVLLTILAAVTILLAVIRHFGSGRSAQAPLSFWNGLRRSMVQGICFCAAAGAAGLGYHVIADDGLLAQANTSAAILRTRASSFTTVVEVDALTQLSKDGATFIDARIPEDFEAGHLPGAINIPVNSSIELRRSRLASVNKHENVVVYCQSNTCPYAESIARRLATDGFDHILLFKGGWHDWAGAHLHPAGAE